MHEAAPVGSLLRVHVARNGLFASAGSRHLLIAAGIGITPLLSLARTLARTSDRSFRLIYLARSREEAAYVDTLDRAPLAPHVTFHFSSEHKGRIDLGPLLRDNADGTHLYYCGPAPLMERVRLLSIHWPRSRVHAESFGKASGTLRDGEPFRVLQTRTGRVFDVGEGETILEALRRQGLQPAASCESGTCGTCRMRLVAGTVDHQDMYLTADERRSAIMPCVSRGVGTIELDF